LPACIKWIKTREKDGDFSIHQQCIIGLVGLLSHFLQLLC
jgi:hypothetical protein